MGSFLVTLERLGGVRGAPTRRAVVTLARRAEITSAARSIVTRRDVVHLLFILCRGKQIEFPRAIEGRGVSGESINTGNQRRGDAGTVDGDPAALVVGVVRSSVRRDRRNVVLSAIRAAVIPLPEGLVTPFAQPEPVPGHVVSLYVEPLFESSVPPTDTTPGSAAGSHD